MARLDVCRTQCLFRFLAEEAVLEVKRVAVAEVQRAVAVAVAESRANERLRAHRLLDLPLSQRNHGALRQGPFLRVHGNPGAVDNNARTVTTPTTTSSTIPTTTEDEKDSHLQTISGSVSIYFLSCTLAIATPPLNR